MSKKKVAKKRTTKKTASKKTPARNTDEKKRRPGAPSSFSWDIAEEILERMIAGESLRKICEDAHTPKITTVLRWVANGEKEDADDDFREFRDQYARARELQADVMFDRAMDEAVKAAELVMLEADESRKSSAVVQAQKLIVDTIKWHAGKIRPKKYGELVKLEHSGKVDSETTVIIKDLTGKQPDGGDDE